MKEKIFIFIFLIIFFLILSGSNILSPRIFAQNNDSPPQTVPRTVLAELFVQVSCPTCPIAEFCLEDLAWEYGTTKLILVQEHLWGDGYDTPETNARYNWYVGDGKKGTPDLFIDGLTKRLQGLSCECAEENYECYKNAIDDELARSSLLEISTSKVLIEFDYTIEGTVKNISDISLEDLAVCGMVGKEGGEPGLYFYIKDIFPFQNMPPLLPGATFNFKFFPEISLIQEVETDKDKGDNKEKEILHLVIFVQNIETKEVLQALYIE